MAVIPAIPSGLGGFSTINRVNIKERSMPAVQQERPPYIILVSTLLVAKIPMLKWTL
ncbi:hypothetical protein BTUL_0174g00010 [Botrytis tulipae]|uniref:Uncharacterized protein n=1 Tax=Botrytis tulipae TaxID=87230 RepID=A0A4Z1EEX3_9HELO|nr:hypothetical protein BTUL_0174g00010 [Botrytis tulipae]